MIASEIVAQRERSDVDRHPPPAAIVSMPRPVVTATGAETKQLRCSSVDLPAVQLGHQVLGESPVWCLGKRR